MYIFSIKMLLIIIYHDLNNIIQYMNKDLTRLLLI
jgi:hypothetical protein